MKKVTRLFLAVVLAFSMVIGLAACAGGGTNDPSKTEEIVITYPTYRVGSHLSAKAEKMIIDGFNEEYAGRIRVEVEELPGDENYIEKMKILAASNALPDVVEGKDGVLELAIRNGQAIDLTDYVNADAAYKAEIGQAAIDANTVDGVLYSIANGNQLIGYFFNKDHFEAAGVKPAETWSDFMANLDLLKKAGFDPVSMMTGENCWTTNLLLAAMVGTDGDAGNAFMKTKHPETYETTEMKTAMEMIQTILKDYTTPDALGASYDIAANHFLLGSTSIIANGPWMTGDFTNTEKAVDGLNVGVALYPNQGMFAQFEIGYLVCATDKAKQDAAFEFIKYKTNMAAQTIMLEESGTLPLTGNLAISEDYMKANPIIAELIELSASAKYDFRTIDQISHAGVIEEMSKNYSLLAMGDITVDEMLELMTTAANKSK